MKSPQLTRLIVVGAFVLLGCRHYTTADDTDVICYDVAPGQPCKNAKGQDSRCSHNSVCIDDLKDCPSTSKLLESCSTIYTNYCFPMFDGKPMQCLSVVDIETIVQRDACSGKSDGTPCKNAYAEPNGRAALTATVYEQEGLCEDSACLATTFTSCNSDKIGAACSVNAVSDGDLVRFDGVCTREEPYRPWCKSSGKGAVIRSATVLVGASSSSVAASTPPSSKTPSPSGLGVTSQRNATSSGVRLWCLMHSRTTYLLDSRSIAVD